MIYPPKYTCVYHLHVDFLCRNCWEKICSCKHPSPPFDLPNFFGKKKRGMGCNDKHMVLSSLLAVYNFPVSEKMIKTNDERVTETGVGLWLHAGLQAAIKCKQQDIARSDMDRNKKKSTRVLERDRDSTGRNSFLFWGCQVAPNFQDCYTTPWKVGWGKHALKAYLARNYVSYFAWSGFRPRVVHHPEKKTLISARYMLQACICPWPCACMHIDCIIIQVIILELLLDVTWQTIISSSP